MYVVHLVYMYLLFLATQNDFLDCYGDPALTGKLGSDIEECKCGWLSVQALLRATPEQQKLFKVCMMCVFV